MGYHHSGKEVYFNRNGDIKEYGYVFKRRDRWRGFLRNLKNWKLDQFADHSVEAYCRYLVKAVRAEEAVLASGGRALSGAELSGPAPSPPKAAAA